MTFTTLPNPGLGTYRLQNEVLKNSLNQALALGYRHVDTAQMYDNEGAIGTTLQASPVPREEIFLTTKVWMDQYRSADFLPSVEASLKKLQTDYVDLLLVHWPSPNGEVPMEEYLGELLRTQKAGMAQHIGLSNFTLAQLEQARTILGDAIFTHQIEVHPFLQNRRVVSYCQQHGIAVTGYMPLAVGRVMEEPVLQRIADAHNVTAAQVALAWQYQLGIIAIPSSTKESHLAGNLKALNVKLSDTEMAMIAELDAGERIANPDFAPRWDD